MRLFSLLAFVFCLGTLLPVQFAYAGGAKSGSVFPRNLSVEEIAKMVYEAAKNDPANAAVIFMDALASRDGWTAPELKLLVDSLLIAVPDMPVSELPSIIVDGTNIPQDVIQQVTEQINSESVVPQSPVIEPQLPTVPVYPVVPSPDEVSDVK